MLDVSSPFHCSLMAEAAQATQRYLGHVPMVDPLVPLVTNLDASELSSVTPIKQALVQVMTRPVQWARAVESCTRETSQYVECGSGVLSSLMTRTSTSKSFPLKDSPSLRDFLNTQFR